jgi:TolA-binding protein
MKRILFFFIPVLFLVACNKGKEKATVTPRDAAVHKIDSLETQIKASIQKQENPDVTLAMHAIKNYQYFAADFPKDTLSPKYLFKAGQLYEGVLRDYPKAAEIYGKIYNDYPEFKNRPMMLFHQGNAYIEAQDTAHASVALKTFIIKYTTHPFADDAQGLLNLMRMNDQEVQNFLKHNEKLPEPGKQVQ